LRTYLTLNYLFFKDLLLPGWIQRPATWFATALSFVIFLRTRAIFRPSKPDFQSLNIRRFQAQKKGAPGALFHCAHKHGYTVLLS
jgi:hypothetical protein